MRLGNNGNPLENKEFFVKVNGIRHWCRIVGAENRTVPIVVIHGGPGGNNYSARYVWRWLGKVTRAH